MIKDLDKLYIGLFLFICLFSCDFNEDKKLGEELKNLTSNFSTSSYFIVIDVKYKDEIFPIVIENYTLYDMMFETRKIDTRDEYISEITKCIMNKDTVIFNSTKDKEILESYKVYENDTLKSLLKRNKKKFINKFFINQRLNTENLSFIDEKTIIYYLFNKRIYCLKDCTSGDILLTIPKKQPPVGEEL